MGFDRDLSLKLDEVQALLDVATESPFRAMLLGRKAALERKALNIRPRVTSRERCDPETWALISRAVRERDGYCCQGCGISGELVAVHHIVPVAAGGSDDPRNLICLCPTCHARIHPWLDAEV